MANQNWIGWAAIAGGVIGIIGFISLALMFVVGEPFGTINDILAIPTAFLMMPLVIALYRLNSADYSLASLPALLAGVIGFLATAAGSILLVTGRIDFRQSLIPGMGGFGLIGLWVLINSVMGLTGHTLPKGPAWMGAVLGITPVLILFALFRVGSVAAMLSATAGQTAAAVQFSPLAIAFFIAGGISYALLPVWFILMGRLAISGQLGLAVGALSVS